MKQFQESQLTKIIKDAFSLAIEGAYSLMRSYGPDEGDKLQAQVDQIVELLQRMKDDKLDVRFEPREY